MQNIIISFAKLEKHEKHFLNSAYKSLYQQNWSIEISKIRKFNKWIQQIEKIKYPDVKQIVLGGINCLLTYVLDIIVCLLIKILLLLPCNGGKLLKQFKIIPLFPATVVVKFVALLIELHDMHIPFRIVK